MKASVGHELLETLGHEAILYKLMIDIELTIGKGRLWS